MTHNTPASRYHANLHRALAVAVLLAAGSLSCVEPGAGPADAVLVVGAPCEGHADCGGGLCLPAIEPVTGEATGFHGGYCTEVDCASGATTCPGNSRCVGEPSGVCLAACGTGAPCREGYACSPAAGGVCIPACSADEDCPGGICHRGSGLCAADIRDVLVGATCAGDVDCGAHGICLDPGLGYPHGYCTASPCDLAASMPELTCPAGSACAGSAAASLCLTECDGTSPCREGYICLSGTCLPACRIDDDCSAAQVCDRPSGACVPDLRLARAVGAACTEENAVAACGAGGTCLAEWVEGEPTGFPDGYCVGLSCLPGIEGRECPGDALCVGGGATALCLATCGPQGPLCREGYACTGRTAPGICIAACTGDVDCDPDGSLLLVCDHRSGLCAPQFDDVPVGALCSEPLHCGTNGTCIAEEPDGAFSGGYCTALPCDEVSPCPQGSTCTGTTTPLCMASCSADVPCREGYVCADGKCIPRCATRDDCGSGFLCDAPSGQCVPDFSDVPVGEGCFGDAACGTLGSCFTQQDGFPGGYCSAIGCSEASPCPAGSLCHGEGAYCLATCASAAECRTPYRCFELDQGNACLP